MHPYKSLPDKAFWRRSVSSPLANEVDPVGEFNLKITKKTKVATAGSCFAQHISRHLSHSGFHYYVAEKGHPILPKSILRKHYYGTFSARYGNIYTARQLLQLFQRAYGEFLPAEEAWVKTDGSIVDPFRPTVQPRGFISIEEMQADRTQHLAAVRHMFETLDVFVFTLGLTECWMTCSDGAVFPLCPGVEGGKFDAEKYVFHNQTVEEVTADMSCFIEGLRRVNEKAQIILTVSPVPLVATANPNTSALSATTYSKAVLRVSAEMLMNQHSHVHYFPSYEVITGNHTRGKYFANDLRSVTEEGVEHVMRLFLKHAANKKVKMFQSVSDTKNQQDSKDDFLSQAEALVEVECDEIALDKF